MPVYLGTKPLTCGYFGTKPLGRSLFNNEDLCSGEKKYQKWRIVAFISEYRSISDSRDYLYFERLTVFNTATNYIGGAHHLNTHDGRKRLVKEFDNSPSKTEYDNITEQGAPSNARDSATKIEVYGRNEDVDNWNYVKTATFGPWSSRQWQTGVNKDFDKHLPKVAHNKFYCEILLAEQFDTNQAIYINSFDIFDEFGDDITDKFETASSWVSQHEPNEGPDKLLDGNTSTFWNTVNNSITKGFSFKTKNDAKVKIGYIRLNGNDNYQKQVPSTFRVYATDVNYKPLWAVAFIDNQPMWTNGGARQWDCTTHPATRVPVGTDKPVVYNLGHVTKEDEGVSTELFVMYLRADKNITTPSGVLHGNTSGSWTDWKITKLVGGKWYKLSCKVVVTRVQMATGATKVTDIHIIKSLKSDWKSVSPINLYQAFKAMPDLKTFKAGPLVTAYNIDATFANNPVLKTVHLSKWFLAKPTNYMKDMFANCPELEYINYLDTRQSAGKNKVNMFGNCPKLIRPSLDEREWLQSHWGSAFDYDYNNPRFIHPSCKLFKLMTFSNANGNVAMTVADLEFLDENGNKIDTSAYAPTGPSVSGGEPVNLFDKDINTVWESDLVGLSEVYWEHPQGVQISAFRMTGAPTDRKKSPINVNFYGHNVDVVNTNNRLLRFLSPSPTWVNGEIKTWIVGDGDYDKQQFGDV